MIQNLDGNCRAAASTLALRRARAGLRALAQAQLTDAQKSAMRANCRSDFMANCMSTSPGSKEALECLQNNFAKLSPGCQAAVKATMPPPPAAPAPPPPPPPPPAAAAPPPLRPHRRPQPPRRLPRRLRPAPHRRRPKPRRRRQAKTAAPKAAHAHAASRRRSPPRRPCAAAAGTGIPAGQGWKSCHWESGSR